MKFNGSSWSQPWEQKVITFAKTLPDQSKGTLDMSTMFQRATLCDKVRSLQHKNIINLEKMLLRFSPATFELLRTFRCIIHIYVIVNL